MSNTDKELEKYLDNLEVENGIKIQDYKKGNKFYKQKYWNKYIFQNWRYGSDRGELVDISKIRNDVLEYEPNFDNFLPGIIKSLEEEGLNIDSILSLDAQAKKALEVSNEVSGNSNKIDETLEKKTKTQEIEGVEISFDELTERIGDLYYDSLSSFLSELSDSIDYNEIKNLVKEASGNISNAWDLCKVPTEKFIIEAEKQIKAGEDVFFKHTDTVKGTNIDNKKLANLIGNLVDSELSKFLEKLSKKMQKDGDADYYRKPKPRQKLGTELYSCADKLNQASRKIK